MSAYETFTTVGGRGEIRLDGVPFQPGTEVEVVISRNKDDSASIADAGHRRTTFCALPGTQHRANRFLAARRAL